MEHFEATIVLGLLIILVVGILAVVVTDASNEWQEEQAFYAGALSMCTHTERSIGDCLWSAKELRKLDALSQWRQNQSTYAEYLAGLEDR